MKKNDVIAREVTLKEGAVVLRNVSTPEIAKAFMENGFLQEWGILPAWELVEDERNIGSKAVALRSPVTKREEAIVQWVIDNEVALKGKDGNYWIVDDITKEPEWEVIQEGVPSYQSSVANLTDEQLRASIEALRNQRDSLPTPKKARTPKETVDKSDPVALALAGMSAEKKLELMRKMGMVD